MDYLTVAKIISYVLLAINSVMLIHYVFFALVGFFFKKKFPHTDEKLNYAVIISARNEESVIGNLIESVRNSNYPQEKLRIFVIAHNCTDKTAEVCRSLGATVYEYDNPNEKMKGYALRYLIDKINEDLPENSFDGFYFLDADNVVDENFFDKMNDAFIAEDKKNIITSYRNSKNFGKNPLSACYGLYFLQGCAFEARGRTLLGCSTRVQGTGFLVGANLLKNGWNYVTLTEDWEFTADQIIDGNKVIYCDDAIFYDEQPTSLKIMFTQRLRWQKGHLLVCITRFKDLIKSLFTPKKKGGSPHKFSIYDLTINILPVLFISGCTLLINLILPLLAPLFGSDVSVIYASLFDTLKTSIVSYVGTMLIGLILYIREGKRIKHVGFFVAFLSLFIWPLFMWIAIPLEFIALFKKNVGWNVIPHLDQTTSAELGKNKKDKH